MLHCGPLHTAAEIIGGFGAMHALLVHWNLDFIERLGLGNPYLKYVFGAAGLVLLVSGVMRVVGCCRGDNNGKGCGSKPC